MTGMDGSPMLSYADKMTTEQTWDVIHYVRTLQVGRKNEENRVLQTAGGGKPPASRKP